MSNYNSSSKDKMVAGIVLIIVLMMTAVFAGCLSEDKESKKDNLEGSEDQPDNGEDQPDNGEDQPDNGEDPDDGDGNESEPPETGEGEGTMITEGTVEALAQATPETVTETVELHIPEDQITGIEFVIKVEDGDGDEDTNPDEVSGNIDSNDGYTETLKQGQTPYTSKINIKPPEGQFLSASWTVILEVVCHASDDQWPGPMIWTGEPDHGFSYEITVTYTYLI